MDVLKQFYAEKEERIKKQGQDKPLNEAAKLFMGQSLRGQYSYNFSWLGRPVIQYPQDLLALSEIIWQVKPKLIVETGVAHGGSVIFSASMLELVGQGGQVLGIDIDIRPHNRPLIEQHPLAKRLTMLEAGSLSGEAIQMARDMAAKGGPVMVILDSNHTRDHVLEEMRLYGPLVSPGSYMVVFDGIIETFPDETRNPDRPWGPGNGPLSAITEFLAGTPGFEIDRDLENKILLTAAPSGYLRRLK